MKPSIIIICLFVASFANSQTVINSTGGFIANGTNSLSYSLGEIAISTITSPQNFWFMNDFCGIIQKMQ